MTDGNLTPATSKQNNEISVNVSEQHVLLNEPAFKRPDSYNFNTVLAAVLKSYSQIRFEKPPMADIKMMVNDICESIKIRYKSVRTEEIPEIFARGIRRAYGDFMGLSAITFEGFISKYLDSRERLDLARSLPTIEAPNEPSEAQKFDTASNLCLECLLSYQVTNAIDISGGVVYLFLEKIGLINLDIAQKDEILQQAKDEVFIRMRMEKMTATDKFKRIEIDNILQGKKSIDEKLKSAARCIALKTFFQSLSFDDLDLMELIKEKKQ